MAPPPPSERAADARGRRVGPRRAAAATPRAFSLETALLALISLSLVYLYVYTSTTDPILLSNRPSGFRAPGANGVHPDYAETAVLEFAEGTDPAYFRLPTKQFAYMFYVTEASYVCAAVHAMDRLVNVLNMDTSRIDLLVLYSDGVGPAMIELMQSTVGARTIRVETILADVTDPTWQESLTKLRAIEEFGYERVVFLDSDAVPMQNLDALFETPLAPLYAPIAYWLAQPFFSTTLMVIEPSNARFQEILQFARRHSATHRYDMDVLNAFFKGTVVHLPPEFSVLNSDFRTSSDARNALFATYSELQKRAKVVHFSCRPDGSYGKPWLVESHDLSFLEAEGIDPFFGQLFADFWLSEAKFCNI